MKSRPVTRMNPPAAGKPPRRARIAALLNAGASLAAAVFVAALSGPKLPPTSGD